MDRFLHIKSSNKYPKTKITTRGNEPPPPQKKRTQTTKSLSDLTIIGSSITKTATTTRFVLLHEGEGGLMSE